MKRKIDKLDVDKWVPIPVDLSKLNNLVRNDFNKKTYIMVRLKMLKIE